MSEKIVTVDAAQSEIVLERDGSMVRAGGHQIEILAVHAAEIELLIDGNWHLIPFVVDGTTVSFAWNGDLWTAEVTGKEAKARSRHRDHITSAPMPGVVTKILVGAGDVVTRGAPLIVLEAMKMEHQIVAPHDGVVEAIHCREGELVQPGVELVTMKETT